MKKKYLNTIEDVLALKDTDTQIYCEGDEGYYQFIQGTLFYIDDDGSIIVSSEMGVGKGFSGKYILEEEPEKVEPEKAVGRLCVFWDDSFPGKMYGILEDFGEDVQTKRLSYYCKDTRWYDNCRRLTPAEVAEITGYDVEEE